MAKHDPRIDAKIGKSPEFARPILSHLRKLAHQGCPQAEETLKWGMPHFLYKGKILFGMGSFKEHIAMGFWLGSLIVGDSAAAEKAMGQFGRVTARKDLPPDKVLLGFINKAMQLIDAGATSPSRAQARAKPKPPAKVPAYLTAALRRDALAGKGFKSLSPSKQREYIEWLEEAKTPETREKRLAQALEWIAEGKGRNWKYEKK